MSSTPRIAVFADFDDTLTTRNVAQFLLKRFAPDALARYSTRYRAGEITFREYQELSFDAVRVPVAEMEDAAANEVELRSGIHELLPAIEMAGGTFTVASAGLRFYIEPVLKKHGLGHIGVVCGTATRNERDAGSFRYDYPFVQANGKPCRGDWATCKCKALEQAGKNEITVFVGDGSTSDACVAPKADYVFARARLLRICDEQRVAATPFEDFTPVTEFVTKLSAAAKARPGQR